MKRKSKVLIRLLTAVLCISLLPVTVMASPDDPAEDPEQDIGMTDTENNFRAWPANEDSNVDTTLIPVPHGKTTVLEVAVEADDVSGISYQWYKYNASTGERTTLDGETNSTLTTDTVERRLDYGCEVTDDISGITQWLFFIVTRENHLTVNLQGEEGTYSILSFRPGDQITLTLDVSADDMDGIRYVWIKDSQTAVGDGTNVLVTDELYENTLYSCHVYDKFGNECTVDIYLTQDNLFHVWPADSEDKEIISVSYMLEHAGDSKELRVSYEAEDDSQLSFCWNLWDAAADDYITIDGADGSTYLAENVDSGRMYRCCVTDGISDETQYVYFNLSIENHFQAVWAGNDDTYIDLYRPIGSTAYFEASVSADDMAGITYKWYINDELVKTATGSFLIIDSVEDEAEILCMIEDGYGTILYLTAFLGIGTENHLEVFSMEEEGNSVNITTDDDSATIYVRVSADDMSGISYDWYVWNEENSEYDLIEGENESSITVAPTLEVAEYYCRVSDSIGGRSERAYFYVRKDNHLKAYDKESGQMYPYVRVEEGQTITLYVEASAEEMDGITYEWFFNGEKTNCYDDHFDVTGGNNGEEYDIRCTVSDEYGNEVFVDYSIRVTSEFNAWVTDATYRYAYKPCYVARGGFVTLSVSNDSISPVSYSWTRQYSGIPYTAEEYPIEQIPGANGSTLVLGPVTSRQFIICNITNEKGETSEVSFLVCVASDFAAWAQNREEGDAIVIKANQGEDITLSAPEIPQFDGTLTYTWIKRPFTMESKEVFTGKDYSFTAGGPEEYLCVITDEYNNDAEFLYRIESDVPFNAWANNYPVDKPDVAYLYRSEDAAMSVLWVATDAPSGTELTYEWYTREGLDSGEPELIPNADMDHIEVGEKTEPAPVYKCKITDQNGWSTWVSFVILTEFSAWGNDGPDNNEENYDYNFVPLLFGEPAQLQVSVLPENANVSYKWYKGDYKSYPEETERLEESSAMLTLDRVEESEWYSCVVVNEEGDKFVVSFDVYCQLGWVAGNADRDEYLNATVKKGQPYTCEVEVFDEVEDSVTYRWVRYVEIPSDPGYFDEEIIPGETGKTLTIASVDEPMEVKCYVEHENGYEQDINFEVDPISTGEAIKLVAANLTLDGYLKVKIKLELPDEFINEDGAYITLNEKTYPVSDLQPQDGYYYLSYNLTSSQIHKPVTINAFQANGQNYPLQTLTGITHEGGYAYSIMQYLATVQAMSLEELGEFTDKPEELKDLVNSLQGYGVLAQDYFADNDASGDIPAEALAKIDEVTHSDLDAYQGVGMNSTNGKIIHTISLSLQTATHFNHYFELQYGADISDYEFYVDGNLITEETTGPITLKAVSENKYRLKIDNIAAADLDKVYNITVKEKASGDKVISTENYSALSYAWYVLNYYENDSRYIKLVMLLKSLYLYNQAANIFFGR